MAKKPNWQNRIISSGEEDADQLLANPFNARIHPQFQQQALEGVLDTIGWVQRVIVNQRTGHVVDGHLRVALAITRGEQVPVDYVDLTEDEEKAILASFDYITSLAVYDKDQLDTLLKQVNSDDARVQELLSKLAEDVGLYKEPPAAPDAQIDRAAELQQKWQVERGQLWEIGKHRLLCGDSTNADDVARMMDGERADAVVTDPPYGVDYSRHIDNPRHDKLANDDTPHPVELLKSFPTTDVMYVFSRWDVLYDWASAITLPIRNIIVWDKQSFGMGDLSTTYAPSWEACIFASVSGHQLRGGRLRDVWSIQKEVNNLHATPKPVEIIKIPIEKSTDRNSVVYDPFGGSGTTMVACEQLGRQCRMIEIEPKYCAVILERMSAMSIEPRLVE